MRKCTSKSHLTYFYLPLSHKEINCILSLYPDDKQAA